MAAEEMFNNLGYEKTLEIKTCVRYKKPSINECDVISIYIPTKTVCKGNLNLRNGRRKYGGDLTFEEIQAVNELIKELEEDK